MAWVKEIKNTQSSPTTTCVLTVPAGGVATGHFVAMGVVTSNATLPSISVADTGGNTWVKDQEILVNGTTTVHQFHAIVTTGLISGNSITITSTTTVNRMACELEEFDDNITGSDVGTTNNNGNVASTSITSGTTATTTSASELVFGVVGFQSVSSSYSATNGYTAGTQVNTGVGGLDRTELVQWLYVSSIGTQAATGTLAFSSIYGATVETYPLYVPAVTIPTAWLKAP